MTTTAVLPALLLCVALVSLVPPVSGILTDPGPVCPGDTVTLTCDVTGGTQLIWSYRATALATIIPSLNIMPPSGPVLVSGVEFSVLVSSTSPDRVSRIVIVADEGMDGRILSCKCGLQIWESCGRTAAPLKEFVVQ